MNRIEKNFTKSSAHIDVDFSTLTGLIAGAIQTIGKRLLTRYGD
jgi:hypothetical protein